MAQLLKHFVARIWFSVLMGGMISGFRRAVGSEDAKGQTKGGNLLWAALLVTAALAIVAWNFAR